MGSKDLENKRKLILEKLWIGLYTFSLFFIHVILIALFVITRQMSSKEDK